MNPFLNQRDRLVSGTVAMLLMLALGCHEDMYNQPRYEALEFSAFFDDGRSSRPRVPGTVIYQEPQQTTELVTGRRNNVLVDEPPVTVDLKLLARGQERFNIYCSMCHGQTGEGNGMIVQRGYKQPPTFHSERLRGVPIGHLFEVMTYGYATMPAYASQVPVGDRWAIAAYIRALQLSQFATVEEVPTDEREQLDRAETEEGPQQ
jgi:mono/diheme cytochrome c family protein